MSTAIRTFRQQYEAVALTLKELGTVDLIAAVKQAH
jgi:hypothetical protein